MAFDVEYFKKSLEMWEGVVKAQQELMKKFTEMQSSFLEFSKFTPFSNNIAVFRAKIQSGGRISIPEADRTALNLKEGDVVKVIVIKE
ncbi:MAG: AbrB/MazE/SpoVT family DNA-binding domain-containing protein [Archaeoglobaceae archaeon]|nr:AbrB/MazE/SpoVT family DNA-binding domain-containing protein [Archaeoglobaceae archaeon]